MPSKLGHKKLVNYCEKFIKNIGREIIPMEWMSAILALILTRKLEFLIRIGVAVLLIIPDVHEKI